MAITSPGWIPRLLNQSAHRTLRSLISANVACFPVTASIYIVQRDNSCPWLIARWNVTTTTRRSSVSHKNTEQCESSCKSDLHNFDLPVRWIPGYQIVARKPIRRYRRIHGKPALPRRLLHYRQSYTVVGTTIQRASFYKTIWYEKIISDFSHW